MVVQQLAEFHHRAAKAHPERIEVIHSQPGTAEDDPAASAGLVQNRAPFLGQPLRIIAAHPVHVVQQHEFRQLLPGMPQEVGNRGGGDRQLIHQSALEPDEIVGFEVFRAAIGRVMSLEIDAPEVIVVEGQARDDGFQGIADEADDLAGILGDDLVALRPGHAQQGQGGVSGQEPAQPGRPHAVPNPRLVDGALFLHRLGSQDVFDGAAQAVHHAGIGQHQLGQEACRPVIKERVAPAFAVEEADVFVPELLGQRRQVWPESIVVHASGVGGTAPTEQGEEGLVIQVADPGHLEFQQGVLDRVDVHGMDFPRSGQEVIEGIAAGAGDDQETIVRTQLESHSVQGWIFPAGVVNEVTAVNRREDSRSQLLFRRTGADHARLSC